MIQALRDLTVWLVARERTAHLYPDDMDKNTPSGIAS